MWLNNEQEKCNLFGKYLRKKATALWIKAAYHGVTVNNWRSVKEHFMFRYKGKVETNTFCHQIPKLFQEKGETVSDFTKRCITEMQEFINSIDKPADDQFDADNFAHTRAQQTQYRDTECWVIIEALAKGCFLMGVYQAIKVTLCRRIQLRSLKPSKKPWNWK